MAKKEYLPSFGKAKQNKILRLYPRYKFYLYYLEEYIQECISKAEPYGNPEICIDSFISQYSEKLVEQDHNLVRVRGYIEHLCKILTVENKILNEFYAIRCMATNKIIHKHISLNYFTATIPCLDHVNGHLRNSNEYRIEAFYMINWKIMNKIRKIQFKKRCEEFNWVKERLAKDLPIHVIYSFEDNTGGLYKVYPYTRRERIGKIKFEYPNSIQLFDYDTKCLTAIWSIDKVQFEEIKEDGQEARA